MKIGIIGAGAYAIALSSLFENKNINLTMWTKISEEYQELVANHTNSKYLNYKIAEEVKFTTNLEEILNNDLIIIALPTKFLNQALNFLHGKVTNQHFLITTKGFEPESKKLIHEYLKNIFKTNNIACLSGPSFAKDIITKELSGLTLASLNQETLNLIQKNIQTSYLTIDTTTDIIGVELCGSLKNVVAIANGILYGLKTNSSTRAKFLVDANKEIKKIIKFFGGNPETINLYAGLGDLFLTATTLESRNYTYGLLIGKGEDYESYQEKNTVEGFETLLVLKNILDEKGFNNHLINTLYQIIILHKNPNLIFDFLRNSK